MNKFTRKLTVLGMTLVSFFTIGCGTKNSTLTQENGYCETEKEITVKLSTDKESYKEGEEISYNLAIENNRTYWNITKIEIAESIPEGFDFTDESAREVDGTLYYGDSIELTGSLYKTKTGDTGATIKTIGQNLDLTFRPYVKVNYGDEQITIRCIINMTLVQEANLIPTTQRDGAVHICCHDPSIFRDNDGMYYVFGSFLATGFSENLNDWTSNDSTFQATFTQETKDLIRAWNKDGSAGSWNSYLWAPDVIYNTTMNKYCMYLSANGDDWKSNIVLLTSDSVYGPYEYAGSVVYGGFNAETIGETDALEVLGVDTIPDRYVTKGVDNKKWGDMFPNCIDPCVFYDEEGNLWMSYGSWSGGIFMLALDEETGLRDYSVTYETDLHSDAYFGTKIAGGAYVSGEASYIQHIGDYYYLFISYGNLEAQGGYNIRVFRSERPDGDYVDENGNTPYYDTYSFNYNTSKGIRLFGGYKWRSMANGEVAQGHNSAFVDADGKAYIVFHTRTTDGTEGHYVKVHQLFVNKEGWLVAAPYVTNGESLSEEGLTKDEIAGDYELIIHEMDIDYKNLEVNKPDVITLNEDGTISGMYIGSWSLDEGTSYITITLDGEEYSGVALNMKIENSTIETLVFSAIGTDNQVTIWGSKVIDYN